MSLVISSLQLFHSLDHSLTAPLVVLSAERSSEQLCPDCVHAVPLTEYGEPLLFLHFFFQMPGMWRFVLVHCM